MSPDIFGRIAAAGTSASTAAATNAQSGIEDAVSPPSCSTNFDVSALPRTQITATAITAACVKPISVNSGSITALWTAQPITGAEPVASGRGNRQRDRERPSTVQSAVATNAHSAAFSVDAIDDLMPKSRPNVNALRNKTAEIYVIGLLKGRQRQP